MSEYLVLIVSVMCSICMSSAVHLLFNASLKRIIATLCDNKTGTEFWVLYTHFLTYLVPLVAVCCVSLFYEDGLSNAEAIHRNLVVVMISLILVFVMVGQSFQKTIRKIQDSEDKERMLVLKKQEYKHTQPLPEPKNI